MSITTQTRRESYECLDKNKWSNAIIQVLKRKESELGLTAREVSIILYNEGFSLSNERQSSAPRLTELVDEGIVKVVGKRKDGITNRNVAVYSLFAE